MAQKGQAVMKQEEAKVPALATQYEEDAGGGFENADRESYAIPFLKILQSNSPEVKKSDGAYIKGAEEGMVMNTVTQQLFSDGIRVVPCYYRRTILEWGDRQAGDSGFYGQHEPTAAVYLNADRNDRNKPVTEDGHILADTREHYVLLLLDDGSWAPAIVSAASTQVKKSKLWMAKMDSIKMPRTDGSKFTPPMFSHVYKLTTVPESNDNNSWMGWKIELEGEVTDPQLYAAAKQFRDAIKRGEVQVKHGDDVDPEISGGDAPQM